ncbi:MAG: DUF3179 domain-containing (seleno)protein [Dehalococcoidia bacterium]
MNMPLNLALYLAGLGATLVPFLPFSPMTIDLVNLPRERQLDIYRRRHWFWAVGGLCFTGLLFVVWSNRETADAAAWWWTVGITLGVVAMLYWGAYVPVVMTPPGTSQLLDPTTAERVAIPSDVVLGLEIGGESRAYLRDQIARPHYFRDVVGGKPVTVSYCILCNSATAFDSTLDGRVLDLKCVTAYNNNIIYADAATGNVIQQLDGRIIDGPARGRALPMLPVAISTWQEWIRLHPDTHLFYSPATTVRDRMVDWMLGWMIPVKKLAARRAPWHRIRGTLDSRLPAMSFVLGVEVNDARCAYPMTELQHQTIVNDELGGTPIAIFLDTDSDIARVYTRQVDGRSLTFQSGVGDAFATDEATGTTWNSSGLALEGPLAGSRLTPVPHFNRLFWFSWALFKPGTRIWTAPVRLVVAAAA